MLENFRANVLNGRFVGKFGTRGSNLGEFNYPASLAVLSDGQIVVSDDYNHRIQILKSTLFFTETKRKAVISGLF